MGYYEKERLTDYDLNKLEELEHEIFGDEIFKYWNKDSLILQYFERTKNAKPVVEPFTHYKHHCKGVINLFGNSIQLKEDYDLGDHAQKVFDKLIQMKGGTVPDVEAPEELKQLIEKKFNHYKNSKPPKREEGDIKVFSKKSRLNLLKKLNSVDFENKKQPFFITLTYPGKYPKDRATYKSDLDVVIKRMKRSFGELAYIWRLEAQKRGAPHYHMIVFIDSEVNIEYMKRWVSQNWYEVVQRKWETKDERHLRVGTNVKYKTPKQMKGYVTKYLSKHEQDGLLDQGRYWGASQNWKDVILDGFEITAKQMIVLKRLIKRYLRDNPKLAKMISRNENIEVWGRYSFFIDALIWVIHNY